MKQAANLRDGDQLSDPAWHDNVLASFLLNSMEYAAI